jgi:Raf kinase inhibitor-like YbhB/YbcL family protein
MKRVIIFLAVTLAAGLSAMTAVVSAAEEGGASMKLTSPAFKDNEFIPKRFSGEGEDVNPALVIENIPPGTKSLVLIVDDPDAPMGTWVHWLLYDIPVVSRIEENSIPGKQGIQSARGVNYHGPYPPSGTHRYFFRIYALDTELGLKGGVSRVEVEKAMQSHMLGKAELMGLYKRK